MKMDKDPTASVAEIVWVVMVLISIVTLFVSFIWVLVHHGWVIIAFCFGVTFCTLAIAAYIWILRPLLKFLCEKFR